MPNPAKKTSPKDAILQAFDKGLRLWHSKSKEEWSSKSEEYWNHFRISSIGECSAKITRDWLKRKDPPPVSVESMQRMLDGDYAHTAMRAVLSDGGLIIKKEEKKLFREFKVDGTKVVLVGHIDNIAIVDGENVVLDYKKAERRSFEFIQRDGLPETYYAQMLGYINCAPEEWGIERGFVVVKATHGVVPMIFEVPNDPKYWKATLKRLAKVAILRKKGEIGRRDYEYGKPPCTWCPHLEQCWGIRAFVDGKVRKLQKGKDSKRMKKGATLIKEAKDLEDEAKSNRSEARKVAIELTGRYNAKTLIGDDGTRIHWVDYPKKRIVLINEEKAIRKGFAEIQESRVVFPKFTLPGETGEDEEDES